MAFAAKVSVGALDGTNGVVFSGVTHFDNAGRGVALIDLNGDGLDEMVISVPGSPPGGAVYVVYGRQSGLFGSITLNTLDPAGGFRIQSAGFSGAVANVGDFNGDGRDDLVIGNGVGGGSVGTAYLIYGSGQAFAASDDLAALTTARGGLRLDGQTPDDFAGYEVAAAGDVNGDGFDDMLIAAPYGDVGGTDAGVAYLVFGRPGASGVLTLASLNGQTGLRLQGAAAGNQMGRVIAGLGDVNGDGFDDIGVGLPPQFGAANQRGSAFVVFGKASGFAATLDLTTLNGANGFRIDGLHADAGLGWSMGGVGDFNGDGLADFAVGASGENTEGGAAYVVFGSTAARPATFDLATLNGTNGFVFNGVGGQTAVGSGALGSAGDINGDGFDDLLIGDIIADVGSHGAAYVVFGKAAGQAPALTLAALDGVAGFQLAGNVVTSSFGDNGTVGDVNGDGLSDILVGAPQMIWVGGNPPAIGHAYMLLGQAGGTSTVGADSFTGAAGVDHYNGLAGADLMRGMGGSDLMRGGPGTDTSVYDTASANYEWWGRGDGTWRVKDLRAGSPDGTDILTDVESLQFSDKTVKILGLTTAEKLTDAYSNILRSTASGAELTFLNNLIGAVNGSTKTLGAAITEIVGKADQTTAVAAMSYQFFLNFVPSKGGFDYLVSPQGPNPNNINSAYYQSFNIENRYINFAVNLGKVGEGAPSFLAEYGAKTLFQATKDAYMEIFGGTVVDSKINTILDSSVGSMSRAQYFALYGGDGLTGIGTKAAMVGWLLTEAAKADLGMYANSSNAFLTDLADGAQTLVDVVGTYGKADYIFNG